MSDRLLFHVGTGDERKTYLWSPTEMRNREAILIEDEVGLTVRQLLAGIGDQSAKAVSAIVWICQRRDNPVLPFASVDFAIGDVEIEDPDEKDPEDPKETPSSQPPEESSSSPNDD